MKKILFFCFVALLCSFNSIAQTLTPTPSTVENGGVVTLTAEQETIFRNITGNISFSELELVTTPTGYRANLSITELKRTQTYDNLWSKPSKFSFKITNSTQENITVTIPFKCTLQNSHPDDSGIINSNYMINVTVIVKPTAPTIFYNDAKSQVFYKNNCGTGFESDPITYSVPANKYSSNISKADANSKAQAEINANGQNKANTEGVCKQVYYNTEVSASFTRNNCGGNSTPGPAVNYIVSAKKHKSFVSQADANLKAQNDITSNGQSYANSNGTCIEPMYMSGTTTTNGGQARTYWISNAPAGSTFVWSVAQSIGHIQSGAGTSSVEIYFDKSGATVNTSGQVKVEVTDNLGVKRTFTKIVTVKNCLTCPEI